MSRSAPTFEEEQIRALAIRVLGTLEAAEEWLRRPAVGLEGKRPIDLMGTSAGRVELRTYLGRLEYGVYH
jgi:putative toxin-antitoxin system antitoxin component (TIGR02293 family)